MKLPKLRVLAFFIIGLSVLLSNQGCSSNTSSNNNTDRWHASLDSPGGTLPFIMHWDGGSSATLHNGDEEITVLVSVSGSEVTFTFPPYDSKISAIRDGSTLTGTWTKTAGIAGKLSTLDFQAVRGDQPRFPLKPAAKVNVDGRWKVQFSSEESPALARFHQTENGRVTGTFRTETGDYRFLEGAVTGTTLSLSVFDGAHAFLFRASLDDAGVLTGDFWSRDSWHETWTATRDETTELTSGFDRTRWVGDVDWGKLSFPDLDGNPWRLDDPEFQGKVRIIEIYGTWCPNCNDAAVFMKELHQKYASRGLAILGLAFEMTGDFSRDAEQVKIYEAKHELPFPSLLAGTSDKGIASETFPLVDRVRSYPTFIFFDQKGYVRDIYSGFDGPATGEVHQKLKESFEERIELLLNEAESNIVESS